MISTATIEECNNNNETKKTHIKFAKYFYEERALQSPRIAAKQKNATND